MTPALRILLLEDDPRDAEFVQDLLEANFPNCELTKVQTRAEFAAALEEDGLDLILADYKLPSFDGISALRLAQEIRPDLPFIFVSGTLGEEIAIEALKFGATDYVLKTGMARLVPSVERALREAQERKRLRLLEADLAHVNRVSMMGELAASLGHEITQPITGLAINARIVLRRLEHDPPDIEGVRQAASKFLGDIDRITGIIERNRLLYRRRMPQHEPTDVNEVIGQMVVMLHERAARHFVSIRTDIDTTLPTAMADQVQLQQVLINLMLNGIEAMKDERGELIITSKKTEDNQLLVSVSDSGGGLPTESPERIFEAFFTTKPDGTGMGLSISRRIIESHGGRLWASANEGRGATFQFTLPPEGTAASPNA